MRACRLVHRRIAARWKALDCPAAVSCVLETVGSRAWPRSGSAAGDRALCTMKDPRGTDIGIMVRNHGGIMAESWCGIMVQKPTFHGRDLGALPAGAAWVAQREVGGAGQHLQRRGPLRRVRQVPHHLFRQ